MGRKKLYSTPEARQEARARSQATHYAKNKSKILSRCKEQYRARRYDQCAVEITEIPDKTTGPIIGHSSTAELDMAEIQNTLAQLETYLGPAGLTAYGATLAEDIYQDNSFDASDRLLDEMETLRDLRDRARNICVRIWERDGATKIWEKSRQCLRPFQEALDLVDTLYDRTLSQS